MNDRESALLSSHRHAINFNYHFLHFITLKHISLLVISHRSHSLARLISSVSQDKIMIYSMRVTKYKKNRFHPPVEKINKSSKHFHLLLSVWEKSEIFAAPLKSFRRLETCDFCGKSWKWVKYEALCVGAPGMCNFRSFIVSPHDIKFLLSTLQ
jgi:hypothetical protein